MLKKYKKNHIKSKLQPICLKLGTTIVHDIPNKLMYITGCYGNVFLTFSIATVLLMEKVLSNHIFSESVRLEGHYGEISKTGSDVIFDVLHSNSVIIGKSP